MLAQSNMFKSMSLSEQQEIYSTLVEDEKRKAMKRAGVLAKSMATDSGKEMGYKGYDPSFGQDTKAFTELVDSVDFPQFVGDLLKAVFNANLRVMKEQTDSYIKLMKEATKSTADFVKNVKDDESFLKLAEAKQEQYSVTSERQADGSNKIVLATPDGDKVDPEDAAVKKDILEAKVLMAKEHRAALREVLLMGVTRLVVEKGEIEASVDFSVKAGRESKAHHDDQNINVTSLNTEYDGGGIGAIFGGPSGSLSSTNTNIQVNTSDKKATDDLSATLHGKVNIKFKTDYFKLDNFANMYGDGGVAALKPPATGSAPAAPAR
ncbi:hypothetical protein [Caballeronia arationis]|uniref:hypothetical protein n=1 Tax=Caballeronia arationis TaxID=1777142 RepID=UPI0011982A88|nr:hypothetical protein [Caballeronia arationis]